MRKLIILSGLFFVTMAANAHVSISYPTGGESFVPGQEITIQWALVQDHGDASWELYYSADDGTNWAEIKTGIDKSVLEYTWTLPLASTNKAKIRVVQNNVSDTNYESISGIFSIASPPDPVITALPDYSKVTDKKVVFNVFPNPAGHSYSLHLYLPNRSNVKLAVISLTGKQVAVPASGYIGEGQHTFEWQPQAQRQGIYLAMGIIDGKKICRKILFNP